ncbi:hypothetical protein [Agrobacterium rosae]|uniref:Uncharacterized protein n=1 Tax=Agrobacterium rosae TaxID=1972867 RepID=A0A1R3U400_9HYPH|nr:hypothetical protein [Agrobacterium rosae]SCX31682.1 hypothetical protein DSM25559_3782 [Agrobacterium rosae]
MEFKNARKIRLQFFYAGSGMLFTVLLFAWATGYDSPVKAFLFSIGVTVAVALFGCWFAMNWFSRITKGVLRWMDLIWVTFSSVSVALALLQIVGLPSDQHQLDIVAAIEKAKTGLLDNVSAFQRNCHGVECGWISRIEDSVSQNHLQQEEVSEICTSRSASPLCSQLTFFAERVADLSEFHRQQDWVIWLRFPLVLFGLIAIAVRFPKSVLELLLNRDNRERIVSHVPDGPVPLAREELSQDWTALIDWLKGRK